MQVDVFISGNDVLRSYRRIGQYRGPKTQIVTNGVLLESDLHLLFDAHLLFQLSPIVAH